MSLVVYEKKGRVGYVTLNRPDKLNAINRELVEELKKIWMNFRDDDGLWVAVLSGAGKAFCVGADINRMDESPDPLTGKRRAIITEALPQTYNVWKPVIAAVQGHVVGGGLWLALGCDIRIAADNALFGVPEARRSIPIAFALPLLKEVPIALARELLFTGNLINAERAYQGFIAHKVVPGGQLAAEASAWAEKICGNSPLVVRATKQAIQLGRDLGYNEMTAFSEGLFEPLRNTEDFQEGRRAFAEKRNPEWKGR